ncbi:MAG: hypothetical protein KC643_21070 [Nitrospira sp.]|nr:hypothetical protein [Nitrospira sp.]
MTNQYLNKFCEVWCVDFEFSGEPGDIQRPICLVAHELLKGKTIRVWESELLGLSHPPYAVGKNSLFVAYYASAELGCHLALGWPLPEHVLDLYAEFRCATNGKVTPCGWGLLGALVYFGLQGRDSLEKEAMRELALRGGPWTPQEQVDLLAYCESDVQALVALLSKMGPQLDIPRGLLRGRFMRAAACMEWTGVPIDTPAFHTLIAHWEGIQEALIGKIDTAYGVYEGRTFKRDRFQSWVANHGISWPKLPSGSLALDEATFKEMAKLYPMLQPLKELRTSLGQLRLAELSVGTDSRNRCLLSAFKAKTSRNQPSTSKFIFGPATWVRSLIKPFPGYGIAYLDWEQQEFGIAAYLSEDSNMIEAYESGDPYLAFAKQAGAVPPSGTKRTHGGLRDQFKVCALAVQYGMGAKALAQKLGQSSARGRELLALHQDTYPRFWEWSQAVQDYALLNHSIHTVFGWRFHVDERTNPRTIRNFPMQANGAEMLRLACSLAVEQGVRVCAPVHDALLIEAPISLLDDAIALTKQAMAQASVLVLGKGPLRTEVKVIRYPDRYHDARGQSMWNTIWTVIQEISGQRLPAA